MLDFSIEGSDGGRIGHVENTTTQKVSAEDIRTILQNSIPFDFIKFDIEGAESKVIPACKGLLQNTKFIFCEYHSTDEEPQNLDEILNVFKEEVSYSYATGFYK